MQVPTPPHTHTSHTHLIWPCVSPQALLLLLLLLLLCVDAGSVLHREVSLAVVDILERLDTFLRSLMQYGCRWVGHCGLTGWGVGGALWGVGREWVVCSFHPCSVFTSACNWYVVVLPSPPLTSPPFSPDAPGRVRQAADVNETCDRTLRSLSRGV